MKLDTDKLNILQKDGYLMIPSFCSIPDNLPEAETNIRFCLEKLPALKEAAETVTEFIRSCFPEAGLVRSILFNKNGELNWSVRWHHDSVICVKEKIEVEGFGPWSLKYGVNHVRIPTEYLDSMITARLHLDDANADNGALQVIPGSHRHGFLSRDEISRMTDKAVLCEAEPGDLLLMKPMILHHSEHAESSRLRRVLHLEYIYRRLPCGLELVDNP